MSTKVMSWSIFIFISGNFYSCSGMKTIMNVLVVIIATGLLTTNTNAASTVLRQAERAAEFILERVKCCRKISCSLYDCVPLGRKNGVMQCKCKKSD